MRYILSSFCFNVNTNISVYRKKTRVHVQNRPCGTMGEKIAFVLGFLVQDMEFVDSIEMYSSWIVFSKKPITYGENEHCRTQKAVGMILKQQMS